MNPNLTPQFPASPAQLNGQVAPQPGAVSPVVSALPTPQVAAPQATNLNGGTPPAASPATPQEPVSSNPTTPGVSRAGRRAAQRALRTAPLNLLGGEADPLSRLRDKWGNPVGRLHVGVIPAMPNDKKVEETRLARVFDLLEAAIPLRANKLAHDYDDVVREQLLRLRAMAQQAKDNLDALNTEIVRRNQALAARQDDLEAERDAATQADRNAITGLDNPLAEAHTTAGAKVALAGGTYEPHAPNTACVLRHTRKPLLALAGEHCLPYEETDARWSGFASEVASILSGVLFGTSLAILPGVIDADELQSGHVPALVLWALFAAIGWAITHKAGAFLAGWARDVSERYWLGRPSIEWGKVLLATVFKALAIYFVWTVVDSKGLMKLAELNAQTGAGGSQVGALGTWALGSVVSLAFVGFACTQGAYQGRHWGVRNRLLSLQEAEFQATDTAVRAHPAVQSALDAIARVQDLIRAKGVLETRVEQVAAPFNAEIAQLESEKEEPQDDYSAAIKIRLQDGFDDWHLANTVWERQLEAAIEQVEGGSGFGRRLWRALFGYPRPKGRNNEGRNRP